MNRPATDLERADAVIRAYRLCRPPDPVGRFSYPKNVADRAELADFVFDVLDQHAARAVLDAPSRHAVSWDPPNG